MEHVKQADVEIYEAIQAEKKRQQDKIELIASENFVSEAVMEAMGSVLTNKYAEGYPNKRYYGGCEYVDVAEDLARDRAKELSVRIMLMFSLILVHRRIWVCISLF